MPQHDIQTSEQTETAVPATEPQTAGPATEPKTAGWTRNRTILAASAAAGAAAVGLGAALFGRRWWRGRTVDESEAAALQRGKTEPGHAGQSGAARAAGTEEMRDPPEQWEKVDETSDESFPASDPPPVGSRVD